MPTVRSSEIAFFKKYPNADPSKFKFISNDETFRAEKGLPPLITTWFIAGKNRLVDIDSWEFKHNSNMQEYLHVDTDVKSGNTAAIINNLPSVNNFPAIYRLNPLFTLQDIPTGKKHKSMYKTNGSFYYYDNFPTEYVLNYPINQFRVYVTEKKYFLSNLPPLPITTTSDKVLFTTDETYYQSIIGTWIASYVSGVSLQHLTFNDSTPKVITSFFRFYLYFTVRRIMRKFKISDGEEILRDYNPVHYLKGKTPKWTWQEVEHTEDPEHSVKVWTGAVRIRDIQGDYKKFIIKRANGFSSKGLLLLNQSIEAYLYCILGAQSKTRKPIVSTLASSLETQAVFRQIVEDTIINYDISTTISDMRLAVKSCNVILNTAISNSLWLLPASMIILKHSIPGYSNILLTADETKMSFGINKSVNQSVKKQAIKESANVDNSDLKPLLPIKSNNSGKKIVIKKKLRDGPIGEKEAFFTATTVIVFLLSRYIL